MKKFYILVLYILYVLSFVIPELFFVPFFMLFHLVWFQVRYVGVMAVIFGLIWDIFWVLPLGFSPMLYLFFLLILIVYRNRFNTFHQLFICSTVLVFATFQGWYLGYSFNSVNIFVFALVFFLSASELRRIREKRKFTLS